MAPSPFSASQLTTLSTTERVTSSFSLLGVVFIISTFLFARGFDKPINRLILFSSWSNLGTSIAFFIARDGVMAWQDSSLCQFQAWALQMFLQVDMFWALCMAINVYFALFRNWTASRMQSVEKWYLLVCYGIALIPSIIYLFLKTHSRGKVYGPAQVWCWVTTKWNFLHYITIGIIWAALVLVFLVYCFALKKVWRARHELRPLLNPLNEDPFADIITTEISIVRTSRSRAKSSDDTKDSQVGTNGNVWPPLLYDDITPYTANVDTGEMERRPTRPEVFRLGEMTRNAAFNETNPDAWLYARVAFLYFLALLLSWIPSSTNRFYALTNPGHPIFGFSYAETLAFPLQGFWNAVVYIITSQTACRNLWRLMLGKPEIPKKNVYAAGLDASKSAMRYENRNRTGKGDQLSNSHNTEAKRSRFTSRGTIQRLDSDDVSLSSLTPAHYP